VSAARIDATAATVAWDGAIMRPEAAAERTALERGQREHDFVVGGRLACSVARPRIVGAAGAAAVARDAELVLRALERIERAILADPERFADMVGRFDDEERELLEMPAPLGRGDVVARLDGTWTGAGIVFYELNGTVPAGVESTHLLDELFVAGPTFAALAGDHRLAPFDLRGGLTETILTAWQGSGGRDLPRIAIVDFLDEVKLTTFHMLAEWMAERGVECHPVDARALELEDGRLVADTGPIDLVYRRLGVVDMLGRKDETRVLREAVRSGAAAMVDPFHVSVLDRKALFAPLSEPEVLHALPAPERDAAARCIPWTRLVRDGATTDPEGGEVDLLETARRDRAGLVLKPNHDRAGHGVVIGATSDAATWERTLERAVGGEEWVVQRAVAPARADYPLLEDASRRATFEESTDPFLFAGRFGGLLTRLAPSGLTNISAGGSTTSVLLARD
jgi:diaminobutyrate-2-oxoglutarate transaminase